MRKPTLTLLLIAGVLVFLAAAALAGPAVDGTPTSGTVSAATFSATFPAGFGAGNAGDCCFLQYSGNQTIATSSGCFNTWTQQLGATGWDLSTRVTAVFSHVYANGDTIPTCNLASSAVGSWTNTCYKNSDRCSLGAGLTAQVNDSSTTHVMSGPGIVGTSGDLHLFFGSTGGSSTFSTYNDSLTQQVTKSNGTASTQEADFIFTSSGAAPTAQATTSALARNIGIEGDLRVGPTTPTIGSIAANSPNSVKIVFTTGNSRSFQVGCSTDHSHSIVTEWLPTAGSGTSVSNTVYVAQMEPSTGYYCVVTAAGDNDGGGATLVSAETALTTTNGALTPKTMTVNWRQGPAGSSDYTTGAASKTRSFNYDFYPTYWDSGDGRSGTETTSGKIITSVDDNGNGSSAVGSGSGNSSNLSLQQFTLDGNGTLATMSLVNKLSDYGVASQANRPVCWSDGYDYKNVVVHAEASQLFIFPYRWIQVSPFTTGFSTVMRSDDDGAHWVSPDHTSTSATGDAPCSAGIMWPSTSAKLSLFLSAVEDPSESGGVVNNPIDGSDAYAYFIFQDGSADDYLARIHKSLAPGYSGVAFTGWQDVTKWEFWTDGASDDDENNPNDWSTTLSSAASIFSESGFCAAQLLRPAWIPDFQEYAATASACGNLVVLQADHLVGPWASISGADAAPFTASPWLATWPIGGLSALFRTWPSFLAGSYTKVNSSNPLVVRLNAFHSGFSAQENTGNDQLDLYSAMSLPVWLSEPDPVSASFGNGGTVSGARAVQIARNDTIGNGGTVTASRAIKVARADSIGNGGTVSGARSVQIARNDSIGNGGTISGASTEQLSRSASFGNGATVGAARAVIVSRAGSFGGGGIVSGARAVVSWISGLLNTAGQILGIVTATPAFKMPPFIVANAPITSRLATAPATIGALVVTSQSIVSSFVPAAPMKWN